jgi:hypothetical protein
LQDVVDAEAEPVAQKIMDDQQTPIEVGLRQAATAALASYLNDHRGFLVTCPKIPTKMT